MVLNSKMQDEQTKFINTTICWNYANKYAEILNEDYFNKTGKNDLKFYAEVPSLKYVKIMAHHPLIREKGNKEVHCLINHQTGDVYTYSHQLRGNISCDEQREQMFNRIEFTGDYLMTYTQQNTSIGSKLRGKTPHLKMSVFSKEVTNKNIEKASLSNWMKYRQDKVDTEKLHKFLKTTSSRYIDREEIEQWLNHSKTNQFNEQPTKSYETVYH